MSSTVSSEWKFSWDNRTDPDGMPAGIYKYTPYPLYSDTTAFTIQTEEGPVTYSVGEKHFVDGGYTGATSNGTWEQPWKTIKKALNNVGDGHKAILVRGAHDDFDGVYDEVGLVLRSGIDRSRPFVIAGYAQERPVIQGMSRNVDTVSAWGDVSYALLQRLKLQNNYRNGFSTYGSDHHISLVDVWLYNNCKWDYIRSRRWGDGNAYVFGSGNVWIFHCLSEHTDGHGFKLGDGVEDCTVEWSIAKESGYWDGYLFPSRDIGHPTTMDAVADGSSSDMDGDGREDYNLNVMIRYNIFATSLFYAVQIRRCINFEFHHNEVYDGIHFGEVANCLPRSAGGNQILVLAEKTSGNIHSNIVRDPGNNEAPYGVTGIAVVECASSSLPINIVNNLIYGHEKETSIDIRSYDSDNYVNIVNNSIYANTDHPVITVNRGDRTRIFNNIIYQDGPGACMETDSSIHNYNLFFAPYGRIGVIMEQREVSQNPAWESLPVAGYSMTKGKLMTGSPCIDSGLPLNEHFDFDANFIHRPQGNSWDMGAFEYRIESTSSDVGDWNLYE